MDIRYPLMAAAFGSAVNLLAQLPTAPQQRDQPAYTYHVDREIPLVFLGETRPLRDMPDANVGELIPSRKGRPRKDRDEEEEERRVWNRSVDPGAQPQGVDPAWQTTHPLYTQDDRGVDANVDAFNATGVYPADPNMDVGPNQAVLAVNNSSSSLLRIFNKSLGTITASKQLSTLTGVVGGGDPCVIYDAIADRWLLSEFNASGANRFFIAISTTADPTGTYYAYTYMLSTFPDYPKYAAWNNMYIVTSNESSSNGIYALPRAAMLAGTAGTIVHFTVAHYPSIGFQACTPVTFDGGTAPPAGAPGMFMRMLDDAWTTTTSDVDQLELWNINYNVATPASSTITGPQTMPTAAFDSDLCGYTTLDCIPQSGTSTKMDPIREVLLNRIQYRNFGDHEAIVLNHSVDVNATDRAAPRWYELRRTGVVTNPWSIYQQGTFSPDATRRWMGSIAINANGDIGLMYNVSSSTLFPGIRYTGRYASDPLGQMTFAETTVIDGGAFNSVDRWGDYNSLDVDPTDGTTFFGAACYIPAANSNNWRSRAFKFSFTPQNITVAPKVFLEGPFDGVSLMSDGLRSASLLPNTQPYTALGYTFTGSPGAGGTVAASVFTTTGGNAIVDWVIVELRDPATPTSVLASCAALVQRDGDVVALDGVSPVSFARTAGTYYVAIRHRNHLGVMTASSVALAAAPVTLDFTTAALGTYGTAAEQLVGTAYILWTGDVSFNHQLAYTGAGNDRDPILVRVGSTTPNNTTSGYFVEDTNLDGVVGYTGSGNDRDVILINVGSTTPNNTRAEQVP